MPKATGDRTEFLDKLTRGLQESLADAAADGGAAADAARERRDAEIRKVQADYTAATPPDLSQGGALVNPDAGPADAGPKAKKKAR
jgi:hypothetical protein